GTIPNELLDDRLVVHLYSPARAGTTAAKLSPLYHAPPPLIPLPSAARASRTGGSRASAGPGGPARLRPPRRSSPRPLPAARGPVARAAPCGPSADRSLSCFPADPAVETSRRARAAAPS